MCTSCPYSEMSWSTGQTGRMQSWRVRQALNAVNGSTILGLGVAAAGRADLQRGPDGLVLATGARLAPPGARALTLGDVVITRQGEDWLLRRPRLLRHEARHAWQYAACLGLPMLPLYVVAAGWSYARGGDVAVHNPFERLAGLSDGGYPAVSARRRTRAR